MSRMGTRSARNRHFGSERSRRVYCFRGGTLTSPGRSDNHRQFGFNPVSLLEPRRRVAVIRHQGRFEGLAGGHPTAGAPERAGCWRKGAGSSMSPTPTRNTGHGHPTRRPAKAIGGDDPIRHRPSGTGRLHAKGLAGAPTARWMSILLVGQTPIPTKPRRDKRQGSPGARTRSGSIPTGWYSHVEFEFA